MAADTSHQNGHAKASHKKPKPRFRSSVSYIPAQSDNLAVTSNEAARRAPFRLALRDCMTFVGMLNLFPDIFLPFWTSNSDNEFYLKGSNIFGLAVLSFVSVFTLVAVVLAIPAFILLPGWATVSILTSGTALVHLLCWPIQGPSLVRSKPPADTAVIAKQQLLASERWIFMNGCCVTGHMLQQNLDLLSETFGRPVQGIHNRTYGIVGDIVECIIQRSFGFYSEETRVSYEYVKAYCTDPDVTKVVLIGHSQGGIMASQIIDELFMDLPSEAVSKLEVYTFGNAASHFNNPLRKTADSASCTPSWILSPNGTTASSPHPLRSSSQPNAITSPTSIISPMTPLPTTTQALTQSTTTNNPSDVPQSIANTSSRTSTISPLLPKRVIPHIEHYCNSHDMVTRWGTLYSAKSILDNRFCGHIFIAEGATGHMLNQHYLEKMFPISSKQELDAASRTVNKTLARIVGSLLRILPTRWTQARVESEDIPFLDRLVDLDTATVASRDRNAAKQLTIMRQDSMPLEKSTSTSQPISNDLPFSNLIGSSRTQRLQHKLSLRLGDEDVLREDDLAGAEGSRISVAMAARIATDETKGRTVKELSRLWRYMGGESPGD